MSATTPMKQRLEMHKASPEAYQAMRTLSAYTEGHAPDEVYEQVRAQFSEEEIAKLSLAIATINAWNRLAVGMRFIPKA